MGNFLPQKPSFNQVKQRLLHSPGRTHAGALPGAAPDPLERSLRSWQLNGPLLGRQPALGRP